MLFGTVENGCVLVFGSSMHLFGSSMHHSFRPVENVVAAKTEGQTKKQLYLGRFGSHFYWLKGCPKACKNQIAKLKNVIVFLFSGTILRNMQAHSGCLCVYRKTDNIYRLLDRVYIALYHAQNDSTGGVFRAVQPDTVRSRNFIIDFVVRLRSYPDHTNLDWLALAASVPSTFGLERDARHARSLVQAGDRSDSPHLQDLADGALR